MATLYISIQGSYQSLELALFKDTVCLKNVLFYDKKASSFLIPYLDNLLQEFSYNFSDLSFIAVDKGPGAFTSLRVIIATLNGMGFAAPILLIGIDGLQALFQQTVTALNKQSYPDVVVCLLNAYGKEIYFFVQSLDTSSGELIELPHYGYQNIHLFLEDLSEKYPLQTILFTGNGTELYLDVISKMFGEHALTENPCVHTVSACEIGERAYQVWQEDRSCAQSSIIPHYIKTQFFAITR